MLQDFRLLLQRLTVSALLGFVFFPNTFLAQEWRRFELQGSFDEYANRGNTFRGVDPEKEYSTSYTLGDGRTSYSLSLQQPVENNAGDIAIGVNIRGGNSVYFAIKCDKIVDLGASDVPPATITLPRNFKTQGYYPPKALVAGRYYYVIAGGRHCLIQPLSLQGINVRISHETKGFFGSTQYSADGRVSFRYVSADSLESLQKAIRPVAQFNPVASLPKDISSGSVPSAKSSLPLNVEKSTESRGSPSASSLATDYEQWQKDRKAFMELPVDKAGLRECDTILTRCKELDAQIEVLLIDLDSSLTSKQGQITALEKRIKDIGNPQVRDRIQTIITDLNKQVTDSTAAQRAWTTQRQSLQKSRGELSEYRSVLEVVKRK